MAGIPSITVSWEAEYDDGTIYAERLGGRYEHIDRDRLAVFRLVAPGEILTELRAVNGITGHSLAYRRRTVTNGRDKGVWFVLGWIPEGPVVAVNPETLTFRRERRLQAGSGPLGRMMPLPFERWQGNVAGHVTDAVLRPQRIRLPSGYVLKV